MHNICTICTRYAHKYESTYIQYIHIHTIWIDLCVCMCMYLQKYTYTYSDSYIPNTYVQNFACICMYGMYVHVYACICMHEPTSKYACCQQQQMNSSEIPLREPEKQQTQTAKDVRELNNIHNWIWSPDFTVVPIPVPRQLESLRLCPILTEDSDNSRLTRRAHIWKVALL